MFDNISMDKVKKHISFAGNNNDVFDGDNTIPDLQYKGVTAICKIIHERQYAYLADEVGMGKTYQAIGVIAMLLAEKQGAKVLVIAPNEAVQKNWESEIKNFNNNNFNDSSAIEAELIHPVDLTEKKNEQKTVSIVRMTSFSTIADHIMKKAVQGYRHKDAVSGEELSAGLKAVLDVDINISSGNYSSYDAGKICGCAMRRYGPGFDLVIIDEAQNTRNINNATSFFNYWLGLRRLKPDVTIQNLLMGAENLKESKFLLLSATPAHRGVEALRNQLLYYENGEKLPDINHEFLEKFMIRRLRTYGGNNKYNIRANNTYDVAEKMNVEQRLFLALIQSRLAQLQAANNATFKIGFLETFESYDVAPAKEIQDEETGEKGKEFENGGSTEVDEKGAALDKKMLQNIAASYANAFNGDRCPPHPKLDFMKNEAEELVKNNLCKKSTATPDKAIVFVRRLATVNELVNRRLNKLYEDKILEYWNQRLATNASGPVLKIIQNEFQKLYKGTENQDILQELESIAEETEENDEESKSAFIRWLAVKKSDKDNPYNCVSLFKKSMMRNKTNSYFFDENYYRTIHPELTKEELNDVAAGCVEEVNSYIAADPKRYNQGTDSKPKLNYSNLMALICYVALARENHPLADKLKVYYELGEKGETTESITIDKFKIQEILQRTSLWNCVQSKVVKDLLKGDDKVYNINNFGKREVLKSLTEKYLKASEAVLEILYVYCKADRKLIDKEELCKQIWAALYSDECSHGQRIDKLFENANLVIKQVLGEKKVTEITYQYDPSFMNFQQWVVAATGGNKGNAALIKRFNTPFYPDIIVCTDVLKEGINLHLFCNKVYHYGLAWSPGDLEQRIGRVDRFFSKTHRERMARMDTKVQVGYPYMGKSIDEHQLRKVLRFKLSADPLLDSNGKNGKEINIDTEDNITIQALAEYVPGSDEQTNTPYAGERFWKTED